MTTLSFFGWALLVFGLLCASIELISRVRTWLENRRLKREAERSPPFPPPLPVLRGDPWRNIHPANMQIRPPAPPERDYTALAESLPPPPKKREGG